MKVGSLIRVSVLIILVLSGYQWLTAAYLTDIPVQVNQPNGTVINCLASGDEFHNWLHDADRYTIIQSPITGYYTYAIQTGDTVSASDFIVGITDPQIAGLTPGINISEAEYQLRRAEAFPEPETRNAPTTGTINNIVIYIRFSDQTEFNQSVSTYEEWFNTNTSSPGSLKNYFLEASYGLLTVNSIFYPTPTTMVVSWQDSHPRGYYCPYNATTNPLGYSDSGQDPNNYRYTREQTLLANAVNGVRSQVPPGLNIDGDNDSYVDNVCFIIRGGIYNSWNSLLWPHRGWLATQPQAVNINGKIVRDYNFHLQDIVSNQDWYGVGVLCHEFFHTLGAPDLYVHNSYMYDPVGEWDLMGQTKNPPQHMGAYMKWRYGGWIPDPQAISVNQTYSLNSIASSSNNVYRIDSPNSDNEYYIVEFRKRTGTYESSVPGSGLLIYRINETASAPPNEVYIYRPNNQWFGQAYYSSEIGRTEINSTTNPAPLLSNGNDGGLCIDQIGSSASSTITFRLCMFQIHGYVSLNTTNQSDVVLTSVKLRRSGTNELVSQVNPNSTGYYSFIVHTPESYYLEYEMFQPALNKFAYPITSDIINVQSTSGPVVMEHVTLTVFNMSSIRVAQSGTGSFTTISEALDFVYALTDSPEYNDESIRIIVFPGNYNENLWVRIPSGGISSLEIRGTIGTQGQTTISGGSNSLTRAIRVQGNNPLGSFILRDIVLEGHSKPGGIVCYNNIGNVLIDNCTIKDFIVPFGFPMSVSHEYYNGIAIQSFAPTIIRNSKIFNNQGVWTQDPYLWDVHGNYYSSMGVVALASDSIIEGCELYNNRAAIAGAIVLFGQNHIVRNNRIFNNRSLDPASDALVIRCNNTSGTKIIHNEFFDNGCEPNYLTSGAVVWLNNSGTINNRSLVANNTFHNNMSGLPPSADYPSDLIAIRVEGDSHLKISNNIITKYPIAISNNGQLPSNSIIKNSLFWQNATNFMGSTYDVTANPGSCFFSDPQITVDYRPIWNTNTKSPCIDNGDPDLNANGFPWYLDPEDQDPDGTRKDIGAYHNPDQHINDYHRLNNYEVKYISIPGVENHPGNQGRNTLQYVFGDYSGNDLFNTLNPILDGITWVYNSDGGVATPNAIPLHYVHSQNGYKVKLLFGETLEKDIVYSGFYPGYNLNPGMYHSELNDYTTKHFITAPDQLDGNCEIDPNTGVLFRETYLGYYLPESLKPFDALLPILDDIKAILAEDWALVRIPIFGYDPQPGDPPSAYYTDLWLGSYLMNNENLAINHGEMVVVHYIGTNDVEFKLGGENPNPPFTESYTRDMTKHFFFEEQLGYIPVFISMDLNQYEDGNKPTEIALFIDEVCKGAAVIKDGEIQLNAYITNSDDLSDDLKEVEFRLYFPAKSASSIVPEYAVFNLQTGVYESKTAKVSDFKGFLRVQLAKTGEVLPPAATQLFQNYPNPFNPVTSIKYDLAENSLVRMDIYNVRGQLVKTLLNQEMLAGTHSVIWDGKDGQGRSVSSGVYFYRMSLPNKVLTNKMLLLK